MVVECGDFRQVIEAPVAGVQNRVFTVQVPFTAGGNVLRISGFTADSKFETGDVWTDFDYIELPKELAAEPFRRNRRSGKFGKLQLLSAI